MSSLDVCQILSHFQEENPQKLVIWVCDDMTIYIRDHDFFGGYEDRKYGLHNPIPFRKEKYIECMLDGCMYLVVRNEYTEILLRTPSTNI